MSAQQNENKTSYHTYYIFPDLFDFFGDDSKRKLKTEVFIIIKNVVLTKNWFVFSNFWKFPKDHTEK